MGCAVVGLGYQQCPESALHEACGDQHEGSTERPQTSEEAVTPMMPIRKIHRKLGLAPPPPRLDGSVQV
jgi:hypothetical protein